MTRSHRDQSPPKETKMKEPNAELPEMHEPAIVMPEALRPSLVKGLEAATRATNLTDIDAAIAQVFAECLPLMLQSHIELVADRTDLKRAVRTGFPFAICSFIAEMLEPGSDATWLYAEHLTKHIRSVVRWY